MKSLRFPCRNALITAAGGSCDVDESVEPLTTSISSGRSGLPNYGKDAYRFFQDRTIRRVRRPRLVADKSSHAEAGPSKTVSTLNPSEVIEKAKGDPLRKVTKGNGFICDIGATWSPLEPEPPLFFTRASDRQVRYEWTDKMREALIISVSQRDALWKKSPSPNSNSWLKPKLWSEVAQEMYEEFGFRFSVDDMRKVWSNLRRTYRRMRNFRKKDPAKAKRWRFLDAMSFLKNHSCSAAASDCGSESSSSLEGLETSSQGGILSCDEVEPLSSNQAVEKLTTSVGERTAKNKKENKVNQPYGHWTRRHLIQVSVPEIDRQIRTKQGKVSVLVEPLLPDHDYDHPMKPKKPFLYRINHEDIEDNLSVELAKVYDKMDSAREEVKGYVENQSKFLENEASSVSPDVIDDLKKKYGDVLCPGEIVLLRRLARESCSKLKETICVAIFGASLKLRKMYHREAMALFIKESMQSGQLQVLLDAYDDFVYYRKPKDPIMLKVISSFDAENRASFAIFFAVIEKFSDTLKLSCPEPRLRRDEYEERQIDEFFDKEKKKKQRFDMEYLAQEEYRRITKARTVAAVKVKKCEDEVQSTKSALETLDPSNFEEKDILEAVLRIAEEAFERALKEQQQVEMEYEEFKRQRHSPPPKKPRARTKSLAKASKRSAARAEEEPMSSSNVELFDSSLKSEPDFLS